MTVPPLPGVRAHGFRGSSKCCAHAVDRAFLLAVIFACLVGLPSGARCEGPGAARHPRRPRRLSPVGQLAATSASARAPTCAAPTTARGGNEGADASHFLYQTPTTSTSRSTSTAPGVLYFARYNHWHGSPWHYVVDGDRHVVQRVEHRRSDQAGGGSIFLPAGRFPRAAGVDVVDDQGRRPDVGADPVREVVPPGVLAHALRHRLLHLPPVRAGHAALAADHGVGRQDAARRRRAGADRPRRDRPRPGRHAGGHDRPQRGLGDVDLPGDDGRAGDSTGRPAMRPGAGAVRAEGAGRRLRPGAAADHLGRPREPSIDAPLALFFGAGTLYNRDGREYLVKAFPVDIRYDGERVHLACYFPMPFFRSAQIELVGAGEAVAGRPLDACGSSRCTRPAEPRRLLPRDLPRPPRRPSPARTSSCSTRARPKAAATGPGTFVGTSFIFSHNADLNTLEGDPRFFFDDSQTPAGPGHRHRGVGRRRRLLGRAEHDPAVRRPPDGRTRRRRTAKNDEDKIESAYRFLLADLMPFGKNARITPRARRRRTNRRSTTRPSPTGTACPAPSLVQTDELQVGDAASETGARVRVARGLGSRTRSRRGTSGASIT